MYVERTGLALVKRVRRCNCRGSRASRCRMLVMSKKSLLTKPLWLSSQRRHGTDLDRLVYRSSTNTRIATVIIWPRIRWAI